MTIKKLTLALFALSLTSTAINAEEQGEWYNLSDPYEIYSGMGVAAGDGGVDLSANFGSYLTGPLAQRIVIESINDIEYYNVNYFVVNDATNSGFSAETSWNKSVWDFNNVNDSSIGVFSKIPQLDGRLFIYPKLNVGFFWADDFKSTTYIRINATTRLNVTEVFWVGVTPTYTYAMRGHELEKLDASADVGLQVSGQFAVMAHMGQAGKFWANIVFTF